MLYLQFLIFLFSSLTTLLLLLIKIPIIVLQQITVVILLILIVFSKKILSFDNSISGKTLRFASLFLTSFLVHLFVSSTGGFYSPFLIFIHLYTLAVSFFLSAAAGLIFIVTSLTFLILASYSNISTLNIFEDDPATGIAYMISFLVIIPLAQLLVRNYQIKDTITRTLGRYLQIDESREKSILQNLNELVIVTDKNLKIISINTAFEKAFKTHLIDIVNKNILDVVPFTYSSGERIVKDALLTDEVILNKATYMLDDYYLTTPSKILGRVALQITPVLDENAQIEQLVFIITEASLRNESMRHNSLEESLKRHREIGEILRKSLLDIKHPELATYTLLFTKDEEDILTLTELEDHPIQEIISFLDVALICQQIIKEKEDLAKALNVPLLFNLPNNESSELIIFNMAKEGSESESAWGFSNFAAPINKKWFDLMIKKILDLSIILSSSFPTPSVSLSLTRDEKEVSVKITAKYYKIPDQSLNELFIQYYGSLGHKTSLKLGSGLEGFIAKLIADELGIVLTAESREDPPELEFIIKLAKNPKTSISQIQT